MTTAIWRISAIATKHPLPKEHANTRIILWTWRQQVTYVLNLKIILNEYYIKYCRFVFSENCAAIKMYLPVFLFLYESFWKGFESDQKWQTLLARWIASIKWLFAWCFINRMQCQLHIKFPILLTVNSPW